MHEITFDYEYPFHIVFLLFKMATGGDSVQWSDRAGKTTYGAAGPRDVLIIVSEGDVSPHPDVVRRRAAIELTEEVRGKLENQGIPRNQQQDDLALVKARYELDSRYTVSELTPPRGEGLTREQALHHITANITNSKSEGGILHSTTPTFHACRSQIHAIIIIIILESIVPSLHTELGFKLWLM